MSAPTMTTAVHPNSRALIRREPPSTGRARNVRKLPLPRADNIEDLVEGVQQLASALSSLLLKENNWKKSLETRRLLKKSVDRFDSFCEGTAKLLQGFSNYSRNLAAVLESIQNPELHSSIRQFIEELRSGAGSISTSEVETHLRDFTQDFVKLLGDASLACVAPYSKILHEVLERLDAFWKVVATYLKDVLDHGSELPHRDVLHDAKNTWLEFSSFLVDAMDVLLRSSDALRSTAGSESSKHHGLLAKLRARLMKKVIGWVGGRPVSQWTHHRK